MRSNYLTIAYAIIFLGISVPSSAIDYMPDSLCNNTILYWQFSEGMGVIAHNSCDTSNFGVIDGPTWTQAQDNDMCLIFDGENDSIRAELDDVGWMAPPSFTIEGWIKLESLPSGDSLNEFFCLWSMYGSKQQIPTMIRTDSTLDFRLLKEDDFHKDISLRSNCKFISGQWFHVACQYKNSTMIIYINDTLDNYKSIDFVPVIPKQSVLHFGMIWRGSFPNPTPYNFYHGMIDDFRISEDSIIFYKPGDANCDGVVDVSDPLAIINYIFLGDSICNLKAANVNGDCTVDISDAVWLINYIFVGGPPPMIFGCNPGEGLAKVAASEASISASESGDNENNVLAISTGAEREIQAVQLEFETFGEVRNIQVEGLIEGLPPFSGHVGGRFKAGMLDLNATVMIPAGQNEIMAISYEGDGRLELVEAILVGTDGEKLNVAINSIDKITTLPGKYELEANIPNPFNPDTRISYSLPQAGQVSLEIFNIMGQKVATLVDEYQEAGRYTVTWDSRNDEGRQVSSGIYLYRLKAGDFVQTRKMVLMK